MSDQPFRDDELRELIALAAVDALDVDEQAALDAAIAGRPDFVAELDELRAAAATMAETASEAPPPALRAAVLAAIADVPQRAADPVDPDAGPGPADPAAPPAVADRAEATDTADPTEPTTLAAVVPMRSRWRRWSVALAAAAAVVVLVAGALVVTQLNGDDSTTERIADVADAPDAVTIPLTGELSGLRLVHAPDLGDTVLVGSDVAPPEGDQVYELWLLEGDAAPVRVETFRPHDDGTVGVLMDDMTPPADAAFAVTVEPPGGVDAPTGPIVAQSA